MIGHITFWGRTGLREKNPMKQDSILLEKSQRFSLDVIRICRHLKEANTEYIMQRQLYRSGTAIGALISEAEFAQSKADFINKLSIALKEANEAKYWMTLLCESQSIHEQSVVQARDLLLELIRMLVASLKTLKRTGSN